METPTLVVAPPQTVEQIRQIAEILPKLLEKLENTQAENVALKMGIQHYTRQQTAELLGFSLKQLDEWTEKKRINAVVFNAEQCKRPRVRYTYSEIKRFSDAHQINTQLLDPAEIEECRGVRSNQYNELLNVISLRAIDVREGRRR